MFNVYYFKEKGFKSGQLCCFHRAHNIQECFVSLFATDDFIISWSLKPSQVIAEGKEIDMST